MVLLQYAQLALTAFCVALLFVVAARLRAGNQAIRRLARAARREAGAEDRGEKREAAYLSVLSKR